MGGCAGIFLFFVCEGLKSPRAIINWSLRSLFVHFPVRCKLYGLVITELVKLILGLSFGEFNVHFSTLRERVFIVLSVFPFV